MTARKYPPVCGFPGCNRSHNAKGLCGPHGAMQRRGEKLRPLQTRTGPLPVPAITRFYRRAFITATGCVEWRGGKTLGGYGTFVAETAHRDGPPATVAHRWIYEQMVARIPDGFDIDHLCRNRACVNVAHLEPVTRQENIRRAAAVKTACPAGHEYSADNTYIRPGTVHRKCKACARLRDQERADRRNAQRREQRARKAAA